MHMQEQVCGRDPFALRVTGTSMSPEFKDGCLIVIDPEGVVSDGAYVLARHGEGYLLRQLFMADGCYELRALQDGHETIPLPDLSSIEGVITRQAGRRREDRKHYS